MDTEIKADVNNLLLLFVTLQKTMLLVHCLCTVYFLFSRFDLRPLTWHLIMNKEKKKKFEAKICGNRNQGKCIEPDVTVCYVTKSNTVAIAKGNNTKLIYDRLKSLFLLKYLNSTGM